VPDFEHALEAGQDSGPSRGDAIQSTGSDGRSACATASRANSGLAAKELQQTATAGDVDRMRRHYCLHDMKRFSLDSSSHNTLHRNLPT
jgi:hypothetical protein